MESKLPQNFPGVAEKLLNLKNIYSYMYYKKEEKPVQKKHTWHFRFFFISCSLREMVQLTKNHVRVTYHHTGH